jgi:uncharacterized protein (DUF58 family)
VNLILRVLYRFYRTFSWFRYRVKRRLTPAGWMVIIALGAAATMGVDTDNTVAYQAFTPLLCLFLASACSAFFFRTRFSAWRVLPRFGTAGAPFNYSVMLKNLRKKTESDLTLLENLADSRPSFAEWRAVQLANERKLRPFRLDQPRDSKPFRRTVTSDGAVPTARGGESVEIPMQMTPLRRGIIRFEGVALARPDPFGLVRAFSSFPAPQTILVLPRRYLLPPIALPGTMKYQEGGVALASNVGQSDEFVALRDYRRGDPLRHIHWRSWAKAGKPIVKEYEDEFFVRHALVLDTFTPEPYSEAFEDAVSLAASFACTLSLQESLLDLLFIGTEAYCFTSGRGLAHSDHMLEILAGVSACTDKPFDQLEHLVMEHASKVSGCICVLLDWDSARRQFVRKLRQLGVPLLIFLVVEPGKAKAVETALDEERPNGFHILEAGRINDGLANLS